MLYTSRLNTIVNWSLLSGILTGLGILGFLLAGDIIRFIKARTLAEEALQISEENLRITLDSIGDGVIATDINGRITRMNRVAEQLTGWKINDAQGKHLNQIFHIIDSTTRQTMEDPVVKVLHNKRIVEFSNNAILLSADAKEYQISDSGAPIQDEKGDIFGVVLIFRDITEKYRLQEQLHHSQKMDAIGHLAGGIAHDFNNILAGIMVSADLILMQLEDKQSVEHAASLIMDTTSMAADLTQKLLTFC